MGNAKGAGTANGAVFGLFFPFLELFPFLPGFPFFPPAFLLGAFPFLLFLTLFTVGTKLITPDWKNEGNMVAIGAKGAKERDGLTGDSVGRAAVGV